MSAAVDALDGEAIIAALPAAVASQLAGLHVADDTGSTQADALAAPVPAAGSALFLAERQSAGQGRRGRRWISPPGASLAFSLSRRFEREPQAMAGLSLAVGIAVAEALHALGHAAVRLKWPNDLLADGRKLGGILVNLRPEARACSAVIGVGINVRLPDAAAAAIDQPWCDLAGLGETPARNALMASVLTHLLPTLAQFEAAGLAPLLPRWQALDALVGEVVQVGEGESIAVGLCLGIAADGALRLRDGEGRVRDFHAGDASVRRA